MYKTDSGCMAKIKNWNPSRSYLGLALTILLSICSSINSEVIFRDNISGIEQSYCFDSLPSIGIAFYFPNELKTDALINSLNDDIQTLTKNKGKVTCCNSHMVNISGLMSAVQFAIYAQIIEKNLVQIKANAYVRGITENKVSKPFLVWERTAIINDPNKDLYSTSKELLSSFIANYYNSYSSKDLPIFYIL